MKRSDRITMWGTALGLFATTIGSSLVLSYKIGIVHEKVLATEKGLEKLTHTVEEMRGEVSDIKSKVDKMEVKVDELWEVHTAKAHSPIALNKAGLEALKTSHIDTFVNDHYKEIVQKVRKLNPLNAYQAQEALISVVSTYRHAGVYRYELEYMAFSSGHSIERLLFVGALSIRDRVLQELGFM